MSYLDSSHFCDRCRHLICQILIYRFKDINYSIYLLIIHYYLLIIYFGIQYIYYLFIVVYLIYSLEIQKPITCDIVV
jgi:hypothetical protein